MIRFFFTYGYGLLSYGFLLSLWGMRLNRDASVRFFFYGLVYLYPRVAQYLIHLKQKLFMLP
jgi:hypothetical protein